MRTTEKHPKTDLSPMSKHEREWLTYSTHLAAFHTYHAPESESLASLKRRHNEAHERERAR